MIIRLAHNPAMAGPAGSDPAPATKSPLPETYQVYVLRNPHGDYYIGLSKDPASRLAQHNAGESRWTKSRGPWRLVWKSEALSLSVARKLENQLKRQKGGDGFFRMTGLE